MHPGVLLLYLILATSKLSAIQSSSEVEASERTWNAAWVTHPTGASRDPIVLHFRRVLTLQQVPKSFVVRVSADQHFTLYINGVRAGDGPARGDLDHWRYERIDLASKLHTGTNVIAATVWNFGVYAPTAQMSDRTAFLLESEATGAQAISTPTGWLVEQEQGHNPLPRKPGDFWEQMLSGPGEIVDAKRYDWTWNTAEPPGSNWIPVAYAMREWTAPEASVAGSAHANRDNPWGLIPDPLPDMEYTPTPVGEVVRTDLPSASDFPNSPVTIPASRHVHVLLDRKVLTTGFPCLRVAGGRGPCLFRVGR